MVYISSSRKAKLVRGTEWELWDVVRSDRLTATNLPLCLIDTNYKSNLCISSFCYPMGRSSTKQSLSELLTCIPEITNPRAICIFPSVK